MALSVYRLMYLYKLPVSGEHELGSDLQSLVCINPLNVTVFNSHKNLVHVCTSGSKRVKKVGRINAVALYVRCTHIGAWEYKDLVRNINHT